MSHGPQSPYCEPFLPGNQYPQTPVALVIIHWRVPLQERLLATGAPGAPGASRLPPPVSDTTLGVGTMPAHYPFPSGSSAGQDRPLGSRTPVPPAPLDLAGKPGQICALATVDFDYMYFLHTFSRYTLVYFAADPPLTFLLWPARSSQSGLGASGQRAGASYTTVIGGDGLY